MPDEEAALISKSITYRCKVEFITIALVCTAFLGGTVACKSSDAANNKGAPPPPLGVKVVTSVSRDVPVIGNWVAVTDGFVNAQIQPQVSGYLIRQDYTEGSQVHKDQVLFEIDPRPLQAILDQAKGQLNQSKSQVVQAQAQLGQTEAQLAQAQAQYELAGINVKRDTPLAREHAIAQSTLDTEIKTEQGNKAAVGSAEAAVSSARAAVVSAQATVTSSQASVAAAELNVGFTKVRSLIDGVAGQATVQVGNLVSPTSVLTSVSQLSPIKVYFSISEQEYLALSSRAKASGKADLLSSGNLIPLKLTLANDEVFPQTGRIIFVDRSVSAQTGSIRLAASFANPRNLLRPGQFGRVSATTDELHGAVLVPQRAVNEIQGQNLVGVLGPDDVVHMHTVQLGAQVGTEIVITSGLQGGERVVTEGNDKLKEGMKVAPTEDKSTGSQSSPGK